MPGIVEFPQVVLEALPDYADLFSCEPQRRHLAEYLTGLLVARKKNVSAINRELLQSDGNFIYDACSGDDDCENGVVTALGGGERCAQAGRSCADDGETAHAGAFGTATWRCPGTWPGCWKAVDKYRSSPMVVLKVPVIWSRPWPPARRR